MCVVVNYLIWLTLITETHVSRKPHVPKSSSQSSILCHSAVERWGRLCCKRDELSWYRVQGRLGMRCVVDSMSTHLC